MAAGLAVEAGASVDPRHEVEFGVLGDGVVDGGVQRLGAAGAAAVDQGGDRVHHGEFAGDVVGLPHLRGDGRGVVGSVGLGVVAAVHHGAAEGEVDEVGAAIVGPGSVVAEGGHARDDDVGVGLADGVLVGAVGVDVGLGAGVEEEVGGGEQLQEGGAVVLGREVERH